VLGRKTDDSGNLNGVNLSVAYYLIYGFSLDGALLKNLLVCPMPIVDER